MTSYDFPPILRHFVPSRACMICTYANFHAMRSNRRRVTRPDGRCELERDTRGVVSRRKSSLRMQKSIAITIHVNRYCYPRSDKPVGYMAFTGGDRTYCATGIVEGGILVARRAKVHQIDFISSNWRLPNCWRATGNQSDSLRKFL